MFNFQKTKTYSNEVSAFFILFAFLFLIVGIYFRFEALEVVRITEWVTRDFDRAFHLFDGDYIPLAGPERNAGGRLLGPFLYFFLSIPLIFDYSYESILIFNLILNIGSIFFFFWVIHKYFGVVTALIVSILLSVNIIHIDSVGLPINPTFMLPLIFVYFWLLFKVTIEGKISYIPLVFVTISLGIQMHFSMATYYLVPLIGCLLFRIKIRWKQLILVMALGGICFIPYLIYKQMYYEVHLEITKTFFNQDFSFFSLLKIFGLQNVLYRINQGTSLFKYYSISDTVVQVEYFFSCVSFYGVTLFIGLKLRNSDIQSCKREVILFLSFYIPALIYEIANPPTGWHFWHYFIFVVPMILIKGRFCSLIIESINSKTLRDTTFILFIIFIGFESFGKLQGIYSENNFLKKTGKLRFGEFYSYNNIKKLLSNLMVELDLQPDTFSQRVLFLGLNQGGIRFLKGNVQKAEKKTDKCFLVWENKAIPYSSQDFSEKIIQVNAGINKLNEDKSIRMGAHRRILLRNITPPKVIDITEYSRNFSQPCYTNATNAFAIGKQIDDYLKNSFGINKGIGSEVVTRELIGQTIFDESSNLKKLKRKTIIFDPKINTPIQVDLSIKSINGKRRGRVEILYYSWGKEKRDYIAINQLDLKIVRKSKLDTPVINSIINSDSWIANKTIDSVTENFSWYREFDLPKNVELKKDDFQIKLIWDVRFPGRRDECCFKLETDIEM